GRGQVVQAFCCRRRNVQGGGGRGEQGDDALAHPQLAGLDGLVARLLSATVGGPGQAAVELLDQGAMEGDVVAEFRRTWIELGLDGRHQPIVGPTKKARRGRAFPDARPGVDQFCASSAAASALSAMCCAASAVAWAASAVALAAEAAASLAASAVASAAWSTLAASSPMPSPVAAAAASAPCWAASM